MSLEGFNRGISYGNYNNCGLANSRVKDVIIQGCRSDWGMWMVNFHHVVFDNIKTMQCANGQYKACLVAASYCAYGNSIEMGCYNYQALAAAISINPLLSRKMVYSAGCYDGTSASKLNELTVIRPQSSSRYAATQLSQATTIASGSSSIAVADSTQFAVGMPVRFSASVAPFVIAQTYFVNSIIDATHITVADDPTSVAISPTAAGTPNITSYGFPDIEITAENAAGSVAASHFYGVDFEGYCDVGIFLHRTNQVLVDTNEISTQAASSGSTHIVFRKTQADIKNPLVLVVRHDLRCGPSVEPEGSLPDRRSCWRGAAIHPGRYRRRLFRVRLAHAPRRPPGQRRLCGQHLHRYGFDLRSAGRNTGAAGAVSVSCNGYGQEDFAP